MVQIIDALIFFGGFAILIVALRWFWFQSERGKIRKSGRKNDDVRFKRIYSDEDDQTYQGRVIEKLRSHLVLGRVEIHWQFFPQYIHRGFVLTGQCRRNDGGWEAL